MKRGFLRLIAGLLTLFLISSVGFAEQDVGISEINKIPDEASLRLRQELTIEAEHTALKSSGETAGGLRSISITPNDNTNDLINALLVQNTGITVTSVSYQGASTAAGLFTDGPFNIDDGIILASGDVINALPPDVSGSTGTDLGLPGCDWCDDIIPGYQSYDASILTITFDVAPSCSTISFEFIFGSEEYPEWVGSSFNDVFGAYLNGVQIAFDENGNAITINGPFFSGSYVQVPPTNGLEYDGSTLKLMTIASVFPGSTNNELIFVVCDAGDHVLDSGVLLAALKGSGEGTPCTGIPPEFDHPPTPECDETLSVLYNNSISFTVQAYDPGPNNDTVTLTALGLPAGAIMTPALPVSGNPIASVFSWTPGIADVGIHGITFVATDSELDTCQLSDECTIYIEVIGCGGPPVCHLPQDTSLVLCSIEEVCLPAYGDNAFGDSIVCEIISGPGYLNNGFWCYTPAGDETVNVTIECSNLCDETCQGSFEISFVIYDKWAVLNIDRSGSMALTNLLMQSRLKRARDLANADIDKLLDPGDADYPGVYRIAVQYFNADGIVLAEDFTTDPNVLHDAVDAITDPRHDTPLAAAMCRGYCMMSDYIGLCDKYLFTYTDGLENESQNFTMCGLCDACNQYIPSGWNHDCDPVLNPGGCTQWQICLYDVFAATGTSIIHYFGEPLNPFAKSGIGLEDLYFLKASAESSDGVFSYHSDMESVCGDANGDGGLNISDAVYLINYVFIGGDEPYMEYSDSNCDGLVNVSDAVWIINYIFIGHNRPCDINGDGSPDC